MALVGSILKRLNAMQYRKVEKKRRSPNPQNDVLARLLKTAKNTQFGTAHQFSEILKASNIKQSYMKQVPITDYNTFHEEWLSKTIEGESNHTWPGKVNHFALSSGTSGAPSKRIPITKEVIKTFQRASLEQATLLHHLDLSSTFYGGQFLTVGGSTSLEYRNGRFEGDLSGILHKYTSRFVAPLIKPESKIGREPSWEKRFELMIQKAPEWNISILTGLPSWTLLLLEMIIERHQLKNIHEIWPNLEVYIHGGIFMEPYLPRLKNVLGRKIILSETYLASEGYFAFLKRNWGQGLALMLNGGVFFEFVPFNDKNFDQDGNLIGNPITFTTKNVELGTDYAVVISTNAGLWRYLIGDLVRFTSLEHSEILLVGRVQQSTSVCGEHLSLDNIHQALSKISKDLSIIINEFTVVVDDAKLQHHFFIASESTINPETIIQRIDEELMIVNDDYKSARSAHLLPPKLTIVDNERFFRFMERRERYGAQNKFPRVLRKEQAQEWIQFLNQV